MLGVCVIIGNEEFVMCPLRCDEVVEGPNFWGLRSLGGGLLTDLVYPVEPSCSMPLARPLSRVVAGTPARARSLSISLSIVFEGVRGCGRIASVASCLFLYGFLFLESLFTCDRHLLHVNPSVSLVPISLAGLYRLTPSAESSAITSIICSRSTLHIVRGWGVFSISTFGLCR